MDKRAKEAKEGKKRAGRQDARKGVGWKGRGEHEGRSIRDERKGHRELLEVLKQKRGLERWRNTADMRPEGEEEPGRKVRASAEGYIWLQ